MLLMRPFASLSSAVIRTASAWTHAFVCLTALAAFSPLRAQAPAPQAEPLAIRPALSLDRLRSGREPIDLLLNRPLLASDGTLVILAGTVDVTALTVVRGTTVSIVPGAFPLDGGDAPLTVLLKRDGRFTGLGTFPLHIQFAGGFATARAAPTIDANSSGALAGGGTNGGSAVSRQQIVSFSGGHRSVHVRPGLTIESQSALVGATAVERALRFGQRGDRAPLVDLGSYLVSLQLPSTRVDIGHVAIGNSRHLLTNFAARGVTLRTGPSWAQLSAGSVAGGAMVGWDNVLGVAESTHRLNTAGLDLELLRKRPGALQLKLAALDGALQPRAGFTQGAVTDAEDSRGTSVELSATTPGQRGRLSAGYTRSAFLVPSRDAQRDSQLTEGLAVRVLPRDTRGARFLEGSLGLLQGTRLFARVPVGLTVSVRHERVDPLFRSVGSFAQADRDQSSVDLNGSLDVLALQGTVSRARDNLANVGSLLTSRTEGASGNAAFSLASLLRITTHPTRWPQVSLGLNTAHQFATQRPSSNDFRPQDLADQVATSLNGSLQWQVAGWMAALRHTQSRQDNQQLTREAADFSNAVEGLSLSRAFGARLDASLEGSVEAQRNEELAQVNRVRRLGLTSNWRPHAGTSLATNVTAAVSRTPPATSNVTNMELRFELAQRVRLFGRGESARTGQLFLRYARTTVRALPFVASTLIDPAPAFTTTMQWTLNSGLSLRLW